VIVFKKPLFAVTIAPKYKISDAGSAFKPTRNRDIFSISEKVKILYVIDIERNLMLKLPSCMARTILPFVNR